jgi:hypothetical protein
MPESSYAPAPAGSGDYAFTVMATSGKNLADTIDSRKVITSGSLSLTVANLDNAQQAVREIMTTHGGHIQYSYFNNVDSNQYWDFTLRIPSAKFAATLTILSELGKVRTSTTGEQDVTEEYMDLEARLRVLHQEEERLLELLKLAKTIDDFLKVESNLSRVRVNIEQTTGRLNYLNDRIDFSTLSLNLRPEVGTVEPELKGFAGMGLRIRNGFLQGVNLLVGLISGVLVLAAVSLPTLIPFVFVLYLLYKLVKKIRNKSKSV